jgi:hypothetical protein
MAAWRRLQAALAAKYPVKRRKKLKIYLADFHNNTPLCRKKSGKA